MKKHWHEMTPEERVADTLRHFPTLLSRWNGGRARFWSLSASHPVFIIRIVRPGARGYLEIRSSPDSICGPMEWENANIEISHEAGVGYLIQDRAAGVRIIAPHVSLAENREG